MYSIGSPPSLKGWDYRYGNPFTAPRYQGYCPFANRFLVPSRKFRSMNHCRFMTFCYKRYCHRPPGLLENWKKYRNGCRACYDEQPMTFLVYQNATIRAKYYTFSVLFGGCFAPESSFSRLFLSLCLPNLSKFVNLGSINGNSPEFSNFFLLAQNLLFKSYRGDTNATS